MKSKLDNKLKKAIDRLLKTTHHMTRGSLDGTLDRIGLKYRALYKKQWNQNKAIDNILKGFIGDSHTRQSFLAASYYKDNLDLKGY